MLKNCARYRRNFSYFFDENKTYIDLRGINEVSMRSTELLVLKRRLKLAALERRLFKIRHDYQLLMLLHLGSKVTPMNRSALAKQIDCSEVSFRKYYNELADSGLIEIIQQIKDKRKKIVQLTALGQKALDAYEKEFKNIMAS
jgi:DNA-binding MarR family transcriptional regulator